VERNYLVAGLGFMLIEQCFEMYLNLRQRKYLKKDSLPKELTSLVEAIDQNKQNVAAPKAQEISREASSEDSKDTSLLGQLKAKFIKSQDYNLDKNGFSFLSMTYSMAMSATMLLSGFQVWLWTQAENVAVDTLGFDSSNELAISSVFLIGSSLVGILMNIPISLYSTFVIEAKHGFNKMTLGLFISDTLKNFVIESALTIPLMCGIIKLVRWGGETFWFYVWVLMVCFSLLMITIYPNFIMPLFNEYKPLPDGELKSEIHSLAKRFEFPLTKLFEVDGSKRSSHSNAYLYGFFKDKRIVLYDTLIRNPDEPALECTTGEILSILAHELAHWKYSHVVKGFVFQNLMFLVGLKSYGYFMNDADMYASFGFSDRPVVIGLNLFSYVLAPVGAVLGLVMNSMTRKFEYEADSFAAEHGKADGLRSGLCKISISNLASFDVDPLYHMFHHSHPTLIQRLTAIDEQVSRSETKKTQ